MNGIQSIPDPDLRAVLNAHWEELFTRFNCHQVGTVQKFDATKLTVEVTLNVRRVVYNQPQAIDAKLQLTPAVIAYPILVDVPVFVNSGGQGAITFPVSPGDTCLVCFNDRDIDNWFATGGSDAPNSARLHDLSDGLALVGFRSLANLLANYDTDGAALRYASTKLKLKEGGAQAVMDANVTLTSTNGGVIAALAKLDLHNASGSLLGALDSVMTALLGWTDTAGNTPNPATIAALTAAKVKIDALLQ